VCFMHQWLPLCRQSLCAAYYRVPSKTQPLQRDPGHSLAGTTVRPCSCAPNSVLVEDT
jgi:hypothetical protein